MDQVLGTRLNFPDPNNLMSFELYITPTDGLYKGAEYRFTITIPSTYPYDPPKAQCETPVSTSFTLFFLKYQHIITVTSYVVMLHYLTQLL